MGLYSITDGHYSILAQEINLFFGPLLFCFLAIEGHYCHIIFMWPEKELPGLNRFEWRLELLASEANLSRRCCHISSPSSNCL